MKNKVIVLCFMSFVFTCHSQNLVRNHDFSEIFDWQERNLRQGWYDRIDSIAPGWWSPTRGTPDFFCCSDIPKRKSAVPENIAGFSYPKKGLGYVGLVLSVPKRGRVSKKGNYREYIQTQLITPLKADQKYCVGFYAKITTKSKYLTHNIGLYLSPKKIKKWSMKNLPVSPQIENKSMLPDHNWQLVCGIYKSKNDEKFIIIGNFNDYFSTTLGKREQTDLSRKINNQQNSDSYALIDNVFVYPINDSSECECFQSKESNDKIVNENKIDSLEQKNEFSKETKLTLPEISFKTNKAILSSAVYPFLDTLALRLKESDDLNILIEGHTDNTGNETENLKLSQKRADAVRDYLILKGINKTRIKIGGKGSSVPVASNNTEEGRRKNRRVEVVFVEK